MIAIGGAADFKAVDVSLGIKSCDSPCMCVCEQDSEQRHMVE